MRAFKTLMLVMLVASATAMLSAQQTKASTTPPKPASPATPAPAPAAPAAAAKDTKDAKPGAPPAETYTYDPGGRRDPFLNLVGVTNDPRGNAKKGEGGPSGMTIAEVSVRGVLQSRGRLVAMVMGPDNKTYIVHEGDRFLDGAIKLITPQGLVIEQEVNDPLSVVKQREIRKLLRGLEDAK